MLVEQSHGGASQGRLSLVVHTSNWSLNRVLTKFDMPSDVYRQFPGLHDAKMSMLSQLQRCSPNYFRDA